MPARNVDAPTDADRELLTDDALAGPFRLYQRRSGHRYSLDDTATAFVAARARPDALRVLDLGSGIGSVLLMLAYKLPRARLCAVEAQPESFELLGRNCARNAVLPRARLFHADLREPALHAELLACARACGGEGFQLITGTPPYQPLGRGSVSPDAQRAHARVELRGGVEAYVLAAGRLLAEGGTCVVCADARRPERVRDAALQAGLGLAARLDVKPAAYKPALFSVFTLLRGEAPAGAPLADELVARDDAGRRTAAAAALRRFFDLPVSADAASPRLRERSQASKAGAR